MAGGGLMQLVAYGAQDVYLTGNPQITFFKVIYRRHTNFSMESIEQTFNGQADWGKKVTCPISRNGDLIGRVYLRVEIPDVTVRAPTTSDTAYGFRWLNSLGHILTKTVEIEIGGQKIDKLYGEWLHIWNELTQTAGHSLGYANMIGNTPDMNERQVIYMTSSGDVKVLGSDETQLVIKGKPLYIPFQFWFCRHTGLALPLIALQYHEVKMTIELRDVRDCYWAGMTTLDNDMPDDTKWTTDLGIVTPGSLPSASLFVNYVYLDSHERRRFAQITHEYLIDQLQFTGDESTSQVSNKFKLNFNHPVRELIWTVQPEDHLDDGDNGKQWFNFTDDHQITDGSDVLGGGAAGGAQYIHTSTFFGKGENPVKLCKIQLNGHDRFSERDGRYFNLVQPYEFHENVPSKGINVFSFGIKPEDFQPSGTCNFSRIDNATLNLHLTDKAVRTSNGSRSCNIKIFARNINVLRIISGMGGLIGLIAAWVLCLNTFVQTLSHVIAGPKSSRPQIFGYSVENSFVLPMAPFTQTESCQRQLLVAC